jgi:hypothetical protein
MRDMIARGLAIVAMVIALVIMVVVIVTPRPSFTPLPSPSTASTPDRPKVVLDCNRPQGHHRWVADMIVPPTSAEDGTTVRLSVRDAQGNTDNTDIDIKGWLCVIDAEMPKVS